MATSTIDIDAIVNGAQAGDVWGADRGLDLETARAAAERLLREKGLVPLRLGNLPGDPPGIVPPQYLLPAGRRFRTLASAVRKRHDMLAASMLNDLLAERGIPVPPPVLALLGRLDGMGFADSARATDCLRDRVRSAIEQATGAPSPDGVVARLLPDLHACGWTFERLQAICAAYPEPADWARLGSDLNAMWAALQRRSRRERSTPRDRHRQLAVAEVRRDGGTQLRAKLDEEVIAEYAEAVGRLPPVIVYRDGKHYWLADGHHRIEAHVRAGRRLIMAVVHIGTRRDAVLHAAGANTDHGVRRSNEDKRKAVRTLLQDEEWGQWSNREIARQCHVSEWLVRDVREEVSACATQMRTVQRGGSVYAMDTAAIGSTPTTPEDEAEVQARLEQMRRQAAREHRDRERLNRKRLADVGRRLLEDDANDADPDTADAMAFRAVCQWLPQLTADERAAVRTLLDRLDQGKAC
jgi:uncharacterized ParB-like nuclease family protein